MLTEKRQVDHYVLARTVSILSLRSHCCHCRWSVHVCQCVNLMLFRFVVIAEVAYLVPNRFSEPSVVRVILLARTLGLLRFAPVCILARREAALIVLTVFAHNRPDVWTTSITCDSDCWVSISHCLQL
jgi:hypothetical protein